MTFDAMYARREVWLWGNMRPGVAGVMIVSIVGAIVIAATVAIGFSTWIVGMLLAVLAFMVASVALATWIAARPRLARAGSLLEVRLTPGGVELIPLEIVECIFRGSDPIRQPGEEADAADFLVGTLVVRLAERATPWHRRTTYMPWGTWEDGHIVIDGRWCEPLSVETVRAVAARLLKAKREMATGHDR